MSKITNFIKNNKLLILAIISIAVLSTFFQEEIRIKREEVSKKEKVITELREKLVKSELKIKELNEQKEKEIQEIIVVNADGSSKTVKNTKSKSTKNSKSLEEKKEEKVVVKKEEKELDLKIKKEEIVHKNPSKLYLYGFGAGNFDPSNPFNNIDPQSGGGIDFQKGSWRIELKYDAINEDLQGMVKYGIEIGL